MPITLDELALIDTLLSKVVELYLLPDAWDERQKHMLNRLHSRILQLHQTWLKADELDAELIFNLKAPMAAVTGYTELVQVMLRDEQKALLLPPLEQILRLTNILVEKIDYLRLHLRNDY